MKYTFVLLIISQGLFGQLDSASINDQLSKLQFQIISKVDDNGISLRWAPNNPQTWFHQRDKGIELEYIAFDPEDTVESDPYAEMTKIHISAWDTVEYDANRALVIENEEALLVAQCHFNSTTNTEGDELENLFAQAENLEDCYMVTLLAADLNKVAAQAAGFSFKLQDVDTSMSYIFRIHIPRNDKYFKGDTIYHYVNPINNSKDYLPYLLLDYEGDKSIRLKWNQVYHRSHFTAYNIERSEDGKNYVQLNGKPYLSNVESANTEGYYTYFDTLANNQTQYYYRLKGIDAFADVSQPSNIIEAKGKDLTPPLIPKLTSLTEIEGGTIDVKWEPSISGDIDEDLKGYNIYLRKDDQEPIIVNQNLLDKSLNSYLLTDLQLGKKNYFKIESVDYNDNASSSFERYLFRIDSIPPNIPMWEGDSHIDEAGGVYINWADNADDVFEYKVFYSNSRNHIFAHKATVKDSSHFRFDIPLDNLTEEIYFKLVAVDANYNLSPFSKIIELKKPDTIPPTPPAFWDYKMDKESITVIWVPSKSNDVLKHVLYRNTENGEMQILAELAGTKERNYRDMDLQSDTKYTYTISAMDDDGNESKCINPLNIKIPKKRIELSIPTISVDETKTAGINIYTDVDEVYFKIYKSIDGGTYGIYKNQESNVFEDLKVSANHSYSYRIRIVDKLGKSSSLSNSVTIEL